MRGATFRLLRKAVTIPQGSCWFGVRVCAGAPTKRQERPPVFLILTINNNSKMTSPRERTVLIIGAEGEFGRFLRRDILPGLGEIHVSLIERETPREEHESSLERARHVVLATPLAG